MSNPVLAFARHALRDAIVPAARGVAAGQASIAAGSADGARSVGAFAVDALAGQPVDVRRQGLAADKSEFLKPLVVGDDEKDVRLSVIR